MGNTRMLGSVVNGNHLRGEEEHENEGRH
jgi:hypothetical protein